MNKYFPKLQKQVEFKFLIVDSFKYVAVSFTQLLLFASSKKLQNDKHIGMGTCTSMQYVKDYSNIELRAFVSKYNRIVGYLIAFSKQQLKLMIDGLL